MLRGMVPVESKFFQLASGVPFGLNVPMKFASEHSKLGRGVALVVASLLIPPLFAACGSGGSGPATTGNASIKNENNYTVTSKLTIPVAPTAPGANLTTCWTMLKTDLLGHPVDSTSTTTNIESVNFLQVVKLTQEQIAAEFAAGTFDTSTSVKLVRSFRVDDAPKGTTCAALSAFHSGQDYLGPQDYVVPTDPNTNYLLLFAHGVVPGQGTKTMTFIAPTTGSAVSEVDAPEGKPLLQFAADLDKPKVNIPAAGPWVIEWSQLTQDGMRGDVIYQNIDSLLLGFYPGMGVADLQAQALDYDRIPTATIYHVAILDGARSVDLATAQTDAGQAFSGFSQTNGVWAVALQCSTCYLPSPIAVVILNPS